MNLAKLEKALLSAARSLPVSDTVPYGFERRVMTQLMSRSVIDAWSWWARGLWRATAPCVAIMILLSVWSFYAPNYGGTGADLSQDFENTVLAVVQQEQPDSSW